MSKEAYEAFNRLARRFHQAKGTDGPATEGEAAQMAAEYIDALIEQLSDEKLATVLDEFRAGKARMTSATASVKQWLDSEEGRRKEQEFKRFIAEVHSRLGSVVPAT